MDTRLDQHGDIALARPALTLLAETIDREFQRRDPRQPTPYEYAATTLGEAFAAFLHSLRTADSPYRLGVYRMTSDNRGLVLTRWEPPVASRDLARWHASGA